MWTSEHGEVAPLMRFSTRLGCGFSGVAFREVTLKPLAWPHCHVLRSPYEVDSGRRPRGSVGEQDPRAVRHAPCRWRPSDTLVVGEGQVWT